MVALAHFVASCHTSVTCLHLDSFRHVWVSRVHICLAHNPFRVEMATQNLSWSPVENRRALDWSTCQWPGEAVLAKGKGLCSVLWLQGGSWLTGRSNIAVSLLLPPHILWKWWPNSSWEHDPSKCQNHEQSTHSGLRMRVLSGKLPWFLPPHFVTLMTSFSLLG